MNKILTSKHNIKIAYTYNPYVRSVCWGVFVDVGSRNETPELNGISHMIEHMCFKGTSRRTASQISKEMDNLGANFNADTGKELTAYYVQCIDDCIEPAVDILSDVVLHHTFPLDEMEKEKQVVLEEIDMCADTPDDVCLDLAALARWGEDSLGYPILGSKQNVTRFTPDDLFAYERKHYVSGNVVLSVVGNIAEEVVLDLADRYFAFPQGESTRPKRVPTPQAGVQKGESKDVEQANVIVSFDGLPYGDEDSAALFVFDSVFGSSGSSVLFERLREQAGLAYSVYSYPTMYQGAGSYSIYIGTNPAKVDKALKMIREIVDEVKDQGIGEEELARGRQQTRSGYVLGVESGMAVMRGQARRLLHLGRVFDEDEEIAQLDRVSLQDVKRVIARLFGVRPTVAVVAKRVDKDYNDYFA